MRSLRYVRSLVDSRQARCCVVLWEPFGRGINTSRGSSLTWLTWGPTNSLTPSPCLQPIRIVREARSPLRLSLTDSGLLKLLASSERSVI